MEKDTLAVAIHLYPDVGFHWYPEAVDVSPGIDCSWCGVPIDDDDHGPLIFHQRVRSLVACIHQDCCIEVSPDQVQQGEENQEESFGWCWLRWGDWRGIPAFVEAARDICE